MKPSTPIFNGASIPERMHHYGFPVRDIRATREFYEDFLGMPLVACWREAIKEDGEIFPAVHVFFGLRDSSILGFTGFADEAVAERYCVAPSISPFVHIALKTDMESQVNIRRRLAEERREFDYIEHGYCHSLYLRDPNGLCIELTADTPVAQIAFAQRRESAHRDLEAWLGGDRSDNNPWRIPIDRATGFSPIVT
ncbi:VOC family protein [Paraburkholderia sp. BL25I1N1]|uniref:VOC family protein n=1 Tax=Paraburkholderia sp. BL25I1N1 TaxID=1938804 RepID=UPI000D073D66|nr:VOC family protein [Paraburkholderia sp. BL25I1N1]PRY09104.1 catechol 2,3-dioxygenase-like lactoylglutathione lyase family enzyme [Paraburkholderia sp. BL25I1N1]